MPASSSDLRRSIYSEVRLPPAVAGAGALPAQTMAPEGRAELSSSAVDYLLSFPPPLIAAFLEDFLG